MKRILASTAYNKDSYISHPAALVAGLTKIAAIHNIRCDEVSSIPGAHSLSLFSKGRTCASNTPTPTVTASPSPTLTMTSSPTVTNTPLNLATTTVVPIATPI